MIAVLVWLVLSVLVGVLVGRVIRLRDRQVPKDLGVVPDL